MILLSNIDGTLTDVTNEPIYRGASNVNEILLIAPFVKSSVVTLCATLPNGVELPPDFAKATNIPTFAGLFTADGVALNAWVYKLQFAMTQIAGDLRLQFAITHTSGTTTTSQIVKQVLPGSGFSDPGEDGEGFTTIQQAVLAAQTAQAAAESSAGEALDFRNEAAEFRNDAKQYAEDAANEKEAAQNAKAAAVASKQAAAQSAAEASEQKEAAQSAADSAGSSAVIAGSQAAAALASANEAKGYADSLNADLLLPKSAFNFTRTDIQRFTSTSLIPTGRIALTPFPTSYIDMFDVTYEKKLASEFDPDWFDVEIADGYGKITLSDAGRTYLQNHTSATISCTVTYTVTLKSF